MARAAAKYGAGPLPGVWLDSLRVARRAWPRLNDGGGYGIARLASEFEISFTHHDAAEDARAAGLLMLRAIADTGYGLEDWLKRVDLTISGQVPGRFASAGDPSGMLAGETVVFTGRLRIPRGVAAQAAAGMGCNVADSINKRTTILVVGDQDLRRTKGNEKSSKHRKAEQMIAAGVPIRIVGESDFMLMVGQAAIEKATLTHPETVSPLSDAANRELVIELAPEASRINDLVERVKLLKRSGDYSAALDLLLAEIGLQERVSVEQECGVAPWYYEQAAIIYRKLDVPHAEIGIFGEICAAAACSGCWTGGIVTQATKSQVAPSFLISNRDLVDLC